MRLHNHGSGSGPHKFQHISLRKQTNPCGEEGKDHNERDITVSEILLDIYKHLCFVPDAQSHYH